MATATGTQKRATPNRTPEDPWRRFLDDEGDLDVSHEIQWIPLADLFVDYHASVIGDDEDSALEYQRRNDTIPKRMGRLFQRDLFQPLIVCLRPGAGDDGRDLYAITDGGSRYRGLTEFMGMPGTVRVPCLVYEWDSEAEIRAYLFLNEERRGLTQVDKFVARVQLGDRDSVAINDMLIEASGVGVRKGGWQCVEAIYAAHKRGNLKQSLAMMDDIGWLAHPKGRNQMTVTGVSLALTLPVLGGGRTVRRTAVARWSAISPTDLAADAKAIAATRVSRGSRSLGKVGAYVLAQAYNYKLQDKNRLDVSSLVLDAPED